MTDIASTLGRVKFAYQRRRWMAAENLPAELRTARLVLSEDAVSCAAPIPLFGRPDQVYATVDARLLIVDTKRRRYPVIRGKDLVQLSAYKLLLANSLDARLAGMSVADYAYVRLVVGGRVQYEPLQLLADAVVMKLWMDYWVHNASDR